MIARWPLHLLLFVALLGLACPRSDVGPGEEGEPPSCGFDPSVSYDPLGEILQLVSADGSTCTYLYREDTSTDDGVLIKSIPFILREMTVGRDDLVEQVTDADALSYAASHHNFTDRAEAVGDTARYRLTLDLCDYDNETFEWIGCFALTAHDLDDDAVLWGPVTLDPA